MRIRPDEDIFVDLPPTPAVQQFLEHMVPVRPDLRVDPLLNDTWSCDPDRCRPLLGRNLCCKVETRCRYLEREHCSIHQDKPLDCALFPLDLVQVDGIRVVTTAKNLEFFETGWCRFDRDMLRCFDGCEGSGQTMFEVQRELLARLFTTAELVLLQRTLATCPTDRG